MSTFLVDASFYDHPKCVSLLRSRPRALSLWLLAGAWCARHDTHGVLPRLDVIPNYRAYTTDAFVLAQAGLWEPVDNSCGYRFHDWDFWQSGAAHHDRTTTVAESDDRSGTALTSANAASRGRAPARGTATTKTKTTTPGGSAACATERDSGTEASRIVGDWLESVPARPPARVIGQVSRLVKEMLAEGIAAGHISAGLTDWATRGLHPSTLPSVVHQQQQPNRGRRPSTTDQRVADNLSVVREYAAREGRLQ